MKEAEVVYVLAHIGPATTDEIQSFLDADTTAGTAVISTWRNGLLIRRKRERPNTMGEDPFEYALRPPAEE